MPTLHDMALMLVRIFAATNLIAGISLFLAIVVIIVVMGTTGQTSHPVPLQVISYFAQYGGAALVIGVALSLFSKKIARYASKS